MEEIENWVDIPGYEGLYQISDMGNVVSLNFHNTGHPRLLCQENIKLGYKRVTLSKNGKTKRFSVHRLVALVFIPNPHGYPCINHKDENTSNNVLSNLEIMTHTDNMNYGETQLRKANSIRNSPKIKKRREGK